MNYIIYKDYTKWERSIFSFSTFKEAKARVKELQSIMPKRQYDIIFAVSLTELKKKLNNKNENRKL